MFCLSNVWLHICFNISLGFVHNHVFSHYFYEIISGAQTSISFLDKSTEDIRDVVFKLVTTFELLSVTSHSADRVMTPFEKFAFWLLFMWYVLHHSGQRALVRF